MNADTKVIEIVAIVENPGSVFTFREDFLIVFRSGRRPQRGVQEQIHLIAVVQIVDLIKYLVG